MQAFAAYQSYFVTCGILVVLLIMAFTDGESHFIQYRLFQGMVVCTLVCALLELSTWMFDGQPGTVAYYGTRASNALLFLFNTTPLMLWVLYVEHQVFQSRSRLRKTGLLLLCLFVLNAVLSLTSLVWDAYFYIDAGNFYHRGRLFLIGIAMYFSLLGYVIVLPIVKRSYLPSNIRRPLIFFSLPATIGVVAQIASYGLNLTWAGSALSLLIIYTNIQNRILSTDYLTGLYNRRQLDIYLHNRVRNLGPDRKLAVWMLDVDKFKMINDNYGHQAGDRALESTAAVLRKTFHHQDFIARYAGDEFVVVFEYSRLEDLASIEQRLLDKLDQFNASREFPFDLSISVGAAVYDAVGCSSSAELLKAADRSMYEAKRRKAAAQPSVF